MTYEEARSVAVGLKVLLDGLETPSESVELSSHGGVILEEFELRSGGLA
jgi:hypothetical protein